MLHSLIDRIEFLEQAVRRGDQDHAYLTRLHAELEKRYEFVAYPWFS